jgi:tryptophan 7-halogenase
MGTNRISRVVILGGGTAGWMTAAALSTALGRNVTIALIESDDIGTIVVGEATIPTIHWFNRLVGFSEADFVRETKASFKLGIEFVDWAEPKHRYFHPFGRYGVTLDGVGFHHRWLKARQEGLKDELDVYSLSTQLAMAGRFAAPVDDPRSILSTLGYAYHFDAGLYARFLRKIAESRGVKRFEGRVEKIQQNPETGFVTAITTQRGDVVEGDLFIDCSGFRALLIEDTLKAGFEDWSAWLPCDRAMAVPCELIAPPEPYTRSTARSAGWQWRIPLQHRVGNGYVYSSAFLSDDEAAATLLANLDGPALADPRPIRFRAGRRKKLWDKNVVAIGLSSGFLEPLESTSIHLIQSGIAKLIALFPDKDMDPNLAQQFNALFARDMDGVRDFLTLHYHATRDKHDPLWDYCRNMAIPDSLRYKLAHFQRSGRVMIGSEDLFQEASWLAVMLGQGIMPEDYNPLADQLNPKANTDQLAAIRDVVARAVPTLTTHAEALQRLMAQS